jgi:hypothetical protein
MPVNESLQRLHFDACLIRAIAISTANAITFIRMSHNAITSLATHAKVIVLCRMGIRAIAYFRKIDVIAFSELDI